MGCNHCEEFSRSHLMRRAVAEAGRGLPAIERGMPLPAGTGLSRRSFLLRSSAAMLSVYGASKLGLARAARRGSPRRPAATTGSWSRSSSTAASTRSRCSRRPRDPIYRTLRPTLALPEGAGTAFAEDPRLRWNPARRGVRRPAPGGEDVGAPGGRLRRAPTSRTSPRATTGRSARLRPNEVTGWMGRLLDPIGTAGQPASGALARRLAVAGAGDGSVPVAAIDGPSYDLWAHGRLGRAGGADVRRGRRARPRRGAGQGRRAAAAGGAAAQAMRAEGAARSRSPARRSRRRSPIPRARASGSARASRRWRRCSHAGLPIRCAAISAPGGVRHPRQPGRELRHRHPARRRHRSPPSRPTSRRAGSPTACSPWSGRSSAAARRRTTPAPITAPAARRS